MSDLLLNPITGDLDVSDFVAPRMIRVDEDIIAMRQLLMITLRSFQGDWFLDSSVGVPYFQQILAVRGEAAVALAAGVLRQAVLDTTGILTVDDFTVTLADRALRVSFFATSIYGTFDLSLDVNI